MSGNNVGDDIRAMAQDVADMGAGYVRMGRRWLEMQRHQVASAAEAERAAGASMGGGEGRGRGGAGPGSTQPPFESSDAADSDYVPPGSSTFGRASYCGVGPKNYTRSDQRITEDLCESLTRDDHVDPSDISVNVSGGVVTLGGSVRNRWMKHRTEDLAAACEGVRNVENNLHVPTAVPPGNPAGPASSDSTAQDA